MPTSKYTKEKAEEICRLYASGVSLVNIIRGMEDAPNMRTVYSWRARHPEFDEDFRLAQRVRAEYFMHLLQSACEDTARGDMDASRLTALSMTYRWFAVKLDKQTYGDVAQLNIADQHGQMLELKDFIASPVPILPQLTVVNEDDQPEDTAVN